MDEKFINIPKPTLVQNIINHLKQEIITGELKPGDQLISIAEMAESLNTKPHTIKEALMYLVGAGLIEIHQPEGIFVAKNFSSAMLDPMIYSVILGQSESLSELKELQKWIEFGILNLTAIRLDKTSLAKLTTQFNIFKKALTAKKDVALLVEEENNFYIQAFEISGNKLLTEIATYIRIFTSEARQKSYKKLVKLKRYDKFVELRENLFEALSKKDCKFVSEMIMNDFTYK